MFFDKNNKFSILYISDSDEDEEKTIKIDNNQILKTKMIYKCLNNRIKDFSRNSIKNKIKKYDNTYNNEKYLEIENNINNLLYNNKNNDKKPIYKNYFENHKRVKSMNILYDI